MTNFYKHFYISLWLVKALRLSVLHQPCYAVIKCSDNRPLHDVANFEFDFCNFFIGGGNESTPRKPSQCDQKDAKNCFRYDCRSHLLPLRFEHMTTALNEHVTKFTQPPRSPICVCVSVCTHKHTQIHTLYLFKCVCVRVYVYVCVRINTQAHAHTHT